MFDRARLYGIIYALAASGGREEKLFGNCAPLAREAFERSLPSDAFPELWFELPLAGEPWFDFHALASREDFNEGSTFSPERTGGYPEVFEWFASQPGKVRQLALSWDVSSGSIDAPAVQLLLAQGSIPTMRGFLEAANHHDTVSAYETFVKRLPKGWFACYTGVFPGRPEVGLRVECIPPKELQNAYATDATLLEEHLAAAGFEAFGDTLVQRCQMLARMPFHLEFQFNVNPDGTAGSTFGASLRFACPPGEPGYHFFDQNGAAGELMGMVEGWGLADERWRLLAGTMFATRVSLHGDSCVVYCYPAFVKLRWRDGAPVDAKTYLIAGVQ